MTVLEFSIGFHPPVCFIEIVHDKWCLDKSVGENENGLERGFVKRGLSSV